VVSSEGVKVRDFIAGSSPYLLIKPDGLAGKRPVRRTETEWKTPNATFEETFEIDMRLEELPLRLVVWDCLEEVHDQKALGRCRAEYFARGLKGDPKEAYMQFVEVPDLDVAPEGSSSGLGGVGARKRAMPRFTEIPDATPENMKQVRAHKHTPLVIKHTHFMFGVSL
jgi:hypothetical protein